MLDHAGPVGEVIVATPTQQKIVADFAGVEAHAGIRPEDGSNAIAAAAAAIARMELGRLDEDTTANVGVIEGGTSGNVVPGHCGIVAETRSLDAERAAKVAGEMTEACAWGASEHGCDVDVRIEELFRGYELPQDSPALALAEAGLRSAGLEPERVAIGGGSDANALRLDGFDCVLLANGTERCSHRRGAGLGDATSSTMLEVCEGIVAAAAEPRGPVSGRLRLRRGVVVDEEPLTVEIDGERRPAWADTALLGEMREGDEVVVNVAALDLGLGSGGFDVVHVNLTRGLEAGAGGGRGAGARRAARDQAQLHLDPAPGRPGRGRSARRGRRSCAAVPRMTKVAATGGAGAAAARAPGAGRLGVRRRPRGRRGLRGRLRADRRRGAARVAQPRRRRAARARAALRATSPRRPPTAASTRRSRSAGALDAAAPARLGRRPRRARAGDHRLETRVRPRRHGGARHRPRGARAGAADDALAAPLRRRPARAPSWRQPPHPDRARAAARRAVEVAVPDGRAMARGSRPRACEAAAAIATALRRASRPTWTATRPRACRRGRWAAGSRRTRSSSRRARRWGGAAGAALRRKG